LAANFVTAQVIRIVTEKVMENVARQMGRPPTGAPPALQAPPDVMAILSGMHQQLVQTQSAVEALEARIVAAETTAEAIQRRWGWPLWAAMVGSVFVAFALGFVAATVLRVLG
jgi:hypothetical protein